MPDGNTIGAAQRPPRPLGSGGALALLSPAAGFYALFFVVPMGSLFVLSFWHAQGFDIMPALSLENYAKIATSPLYRSILLRTIGVGLTTAAVTVPVAFALAYVMRFVFQRRAQIILQLVLISLFSGYLVRIYAWRTILGKQGLLNSTLTWVGLIDRPLEFLIYSKFAVIVTLAGLLLPLAVLPIYASMSNISRDHLEIASDLGSRRLHLVRTILIPMALPGIGTAFAFTFLLAAGDFVTPNLVGGTEGVLISNLIVNFFRGAQIPAGAAPAFLIALFVTVLLIIFRRYLRIEDVVTRG